MYTQVVLGLGSNTSYKGMCPQELLSAACTELRSFIYALCASSVYRTAAMYVTEQEDFFNMMVAGLFEGSPHDLLRRIHEVEAAFGRDRSREIRNGPRSLDIDIELFGDLELHEEGLIVPHERLTERAFVLVPLLEILPQYAERYTEALSALAGQRIEKVR